MTEKTTIIYFERKGEPALATVCLSSSFCEQTDRPYGLTGILRRYDEQNDKIGVVDIGETFPVRVHVNDFEIVG